MAVGAQATLGVLYSACLASLPADLETRCKSVAGTAAWHGLVLTKVMISRWLLSVSGSRSSKSRLCSTFNALKVLVRRAKANMRYCQLQKLGDLLAVQSLHFLIIKLRKKSFAVFRGVTTLIRGRPTFEAVRYSCRVGFLVSFLFFNLCTGNCFFASPRFKVTATASVCL